MFVGLSISVILSVALSAACTSVRPSVCPSVESALDHSNCGAHLMSKGQRSRSFCGGQNTQWI